MNKEDEAKDFEELDTVDRDLTMFIITDLRLLEKKQQVHDLKRKIQTEMLTTYLPTLLLLLITYATTFFKPIYFEAILLDFIHFHPCYPIVSIFIYFHPLLSIFIHFYPQLLGKSDGELDHHAGDDHHLHEQDAGTAPNL